jgi:hypothetical protein
MRPHRLAVVVACFSAASFTVARAETRGVIELFTSQGCSSCPAADKLLGELAKDPTLVSISLPIDYWDYLGWKDTLASPRNTARQRGYSKVRGDRQVYTPQAIVDGSTHVVGSDRGAIEKAIEKVGHTAGALSLPVTLKVENGVLTVGVPNGTGTGARGVAEVWICGISRAVTVAIKRGENRGKTVTYHNVARRWLKLEGWEGKAHTWKVPVKDVGGDGVDGAAVMVQAGTAERPSAILGASMAAVR